MHDIKIAENSHKLSKTHELSEFEKRIKDNERKCCLLSRNQRILQFFLFNAYFSEKFIKNVNNLRV